jgi:para-nitrobenzyl esterase
MRCSPDGTISLVAFVCGILPLAKIARTGSQTFHCHAFNVRARNDSLGPNFHCDESDHMNTLKQIISGSLAYLILTLTAGGATAGEPQAVLPGDVSGPTQPTSVISTASGPVSGLDDGSLVAWLGLPYAAPPVGDLRWRPPEASEKWKDVLKADHLAPACLQNGNLGVFATPGGGEDCLYLNVYADKQAYNRARSSEKKLPVFVWIHGGALHVGQGADNNPRALASDGKALVVTINYRLGIFGILAHPALANEGHAVANYGQMDQTQALRWVQDNIASFGGDPKNVTISGESSGGTSVVAQILSPWSAGLFQQAVEMSGGAMMIREPHFGAVTTLPTAEKLGQGFAKAVGCTDLATAAACLRALTPSQVLAHQDGYLAAQTVIDGDFLPDWPANLLKSGNFNRVRLVSGTTLDEGDFFVALPELATGVPLTEAAYPEALKAFYRDLAPNVLKEYPASNYLTPSDAFSATITDYLFACSAIQLRNLAKQHVDVWSYEFADRTAPSYTAPTSFDLKAAHTFELPYIFPGFHGGSQGIDTQLNPLQEMLAVQMQSYWTSVATAQQWKDWPSVRDQARAVKQFNLTGSRSVSADNYARNHRCEFWNGQGVY